MKKGGWERQFEKKLTDLNYTIGNRIEKISVPPETRFRLPRKIWLLKKAKHVTPKCLVS